VEGVLLAVGDQVGAECSASRKNKAVVVFIKRANLVGGQIASGIFVRSVGANFESFYPFDKGGS
jgi:hypothetical protein